MIEKNSADHKAEYQNRLFSRYLENMIPLNMNSSAAGTISPITASCMGNGAEYTARVF